MTVQLDHLFICTDVGADSAEVLLTFGLKEGSGNRHPGQGTANRRFFFHNFMLELLWVEDPEAAHSAAIQRTGLWERWRDRRSGACPFGVGLRGGQVDRLPFAHWNYCPPYLPDDHLSIVVAANSLQVDEPFQFWIPFGGRPDELQGGRTQPLNHACGLTEVTGVTCAIPKAASPELQSIVEHGLVNLIHAPEYRVELTFDGSQLGASKDFRPLLPLVMRW